MEEGTKTSNNRITTREFYVQLVETNERMDVMERRIMEKLDSLSQIQTNKDEIDKLRGRSNWLDVANGFFAALFATIAAVIGTRVP